MARINPAPRCPACGSSATLPFEDDRDIGSTETFSAIILTVFLLLLALFSVFLALLLSPAGVPIAAVILLVSLLLWRRDKERRRSRPRPRPFVCLDCSRNFKA